SQSGSVRGKPHPNVPWADPGAPEVTKSMRVLPDGLTSVPQHLTLAPGGVVDDLFHPPEIRRIEQIGNNSQERLPGAFRVRGRRIELDPAVRREVSFDPTVRVMLMHDPGVSAPVVLSGPKTVHQPGRNTQLPEHYGHGGRKILAVSFPDIKKE